MNGAERGILLLTGQLGDPEAKPLTAARFRELAKLFAQISSQTPDRELQLQDLAGAGVREEDARHILALLERQEQLDIYLQEGKKRGCCPLTWVTPGYPAVLKKRMGLERPACLWAKGDLSLLEKPAVALVGSRKLHVLNEAFAAEAGRQAALQGLVLVSGNADGADRTAQDACLAHGGQVISVVADRLDSHEARENILYLAEDGYDMGFRGYRALSRNRIIHALPLLTLVAQCSCGKGGTWDGTVKNLKNRWSPVFCLDDGSEGIQALVQRGAEPIEGMDLLNLRQLKPLFGGIGY